MESKPLVKSRSFWGSAGLAVMALSNIDWAQVIAFLEQLISGAVPPNWQPVAHAAAALALAILAAIGVKKRKTEIKGIF